jgi:ubiquitin C-terminal hydrolase
MNSIIQCLSRLPTAVRERLSEQSGEYDTGTRAFVDLFKYMWTEAGDNQRLYRTRSCLLMIRSNLDNGNYNNNCQHDTHEFLIHLLNQICLDLDGRLPANAPLSASMSDGNSTDGNQMWNNYSLENPSIIVETFYGLVKSTVECLMCHEMSYTYSPFAILELAIPSSANECQPLSLQDCLDYYTAEGNPTDRECSVAECSSMTASAKMNIAHWPNILVVQLKRYTWSPADKIATKLDVPVDYPLKWVIRNGEEYNLIGVVEHVGNGPNLGHYKAYRKDRIGYWYCFDDYNVYQVTETEVVNSKRDAYILFYEKIESF